MYNINNAVIVLETNAPCTWYENICQVNLIAIISKKSITISLKALTVKPLIASIHTVIIIST